MRGDHTEFDRPVSGEADAILILGIPGALEDAAPDLGIFPETLHLEKYGLSIEKIYNSEYQHSEAWCAIRSANTKQNS